MNVIDASTKESITLIVKLTRGYAVAELSLYRSININIEGIVDKSYILEDWYIFNRLLVPEQDRNNGVGTLLMNSLIKKADYSKFNIDNSVSPYTDREKNLPRLIKFYSKFGFLMIPGYPDGMYRLHN
jgi:GNAT superfamily N-acetyltransferase